MIKLPSPPPRLLLIFAFIIFTGSISLSYAQGTVVDILDFGAKADGVTINTSAIQNAIDVCHQKGGGTVIVPAGDFLTGSLTLKDNIEFHLAHNAVLLGSTDPDDYPMRSHGDFFSRMDRGGYTALLYALDAENIAVTGHGTIDGQGAFLVQPSGPKSHDESRSRNILFISCRNIRVEDVTLRNSGFWMQHYLNCRDILVRGIRVWNHLRRNNDGIDFDCCQRAVVSDCVIDSDDDALCFKSEGPSPCEDITVTNCMISSHCNAIKMGTGSMGGFRRITISNCIIKPSLDPASAFTYLPWGGISGISLEIVDGGVMEFINIDDIVMQSVNVPLFVRLGNRGALYKPDAPTPSVGRLRHVSFSNIMAYETGAYGSSITGIPGHSVENITLRNIQIFPKAAVSASDYRTDVDERESSYPEGLMWGNLPACGLYLRHVRGLTLDGFHVHLPKPDDRSPIWADDVSDLFIRGAWISGAINPERPFVYTRDVPHPDIQPPRNWEGEITAPIE